MNLGDLEGGVKLESGCSLVQSGEGGTFSSEGLKGGMGAGVARDYTPWIKGYSLQQHAAKMAMADTEPDEGQ